MRRAAALVLACACSFEHGRLSSVASDDADIEDGQLVTSDAMIDAPDPPMLIAAYNIGGEAHTGVDFPGMWAADPNGICNGSTWTEAVNISGTVDDPLFQRYRFRTSGGTIECNIGTALPNDRYEVTLLFGEVYIGAGCPNPAGTRLFDVIIEGVKVEDNLNPVLVGGCCHANATVPGVPFKRLYTVDLTDGTVSIVLDAEPSSDALISAIMLRRL